MGLAQDLKDALAEIDADTNLVAARLDALAALVKNGMTDAEVADVKAALTAERDHLVALAKDPNVPVPPPPPAP